jgi:hypothetical protein
MSIEMLLQDALSVATDEFREFVKNRNLKIVDFVV